MLKSVGEIIDALGGPSAAASLAGVSAPAVSNWKAKGAIPARLFFVFSGELERRGLLVDRTIFGSRLEEARQ